MDTEDAVSRHYSNPSLEELIVAKLLEAGKNPDRLAAQDLSAVDEFHIGGLEATREIAAAAGIGSGSRVLDLGSGLGGPARLFASEFGATVHGVDLTPDFVRAATSLTRRTGLDNQVTFGQGSVLQLGSVPGPFDVATLLHVGMNIADKAALFQEAASVLKPGGIFAIYDIMAVGTQPSIRYPVPWAATADTSFPASPDEYSRLLAEAGFVVERERDRREYGIEFIEQGRAAAAAGTAPGLGLQLVLGPEGGIRMANLLDAFQQGILAPVEMICRLHGRNRSQEAFS